jgi:intracellular septation protein
MFDIPPFHLASSAGIRHMQAMTKPTLPSDDLTQQAKLSKSKPSQWLEFGPLLIFFIAYLYLKRTLPDPKTAIYIAAIILGGLSTLSLIYSTVKHGAIPKMLLFTTLLVVGSAGLSYVFKDPRFIYMKPTVINALFGIGVLGGVVFKKNVIQMIMGEAIEMPIKAWNNLAIRWGIFFFVLAAINEYVWRIYGEDFWVKFKVFGFLPLTILFTMTQLPFIMKNGKIKGEDAVK